MNCFILKKKDRFWIKIIFSNFFNLWRRFEKTGGGGGGGIVEEKYRQVKKNGEIRFKIDERCEVEIEDNVEEREILLINYA